MPLGFICKLLTLTLKVPEETRIVILQQTDAEDVNTVANSEQVIVQSLTTNDRNVLEEVIERATARHEAQQELESKSSRFFPPSLFHLNTTMRITSMRD